MIIEGKVYDYYGKPYRAGMVNDCRARMDPAFTEERTITDRLHDKTHKVRYSPGSINISPLSNLPEWVGDLGDLSKQVTRSQEAMKLKQEKQAMKAAKKQAKLEARAAAKAKKAKSVHNPFEGLKDVPPTLKEWQKKCGGEGYCLGMSKQKVTRRFRPGYDAKLKSFLNRLGTPNAKKLQKALGWA